MRTLKISPSILNEFTSFKRGDYEQWGKTQEDFKQYVLGVYAPNAATSRGTAVHSILEGHPGYRGDNCIAVHEPELGIDWRFSPNVFDEIHCFARTFAESAHEVWDTLRIEAGSVNVYMNMRFDCLDGLELHEFKTTSSSKGYSDYYESLQWRCYMMALPDVQLVHYHIFEMPKADPAKLIDKVKTKSFIYRREETNNQVVLEALNELIGWVLDDPEMLDKLTLDFERMGSQMGDIVQAVYDGQENPVKARRELYRIAGNYDELQGYLNACLKEIQGA